MVYHGMTDKKEKLTYPESTAMHFHIGCGQADILK